MLAWHFVDERLRDGQGVPADGVAVEHDGDLAICRDGLHASERLIDALKYAPGNTICRVECDGIGERQADKFVSASRTVLWRVDGEELLRAFARKVALDVGDLWDMPKVVRSYLESGKDNQRVAARGEARDASRAHAEADEGQAAAAGEAARAAAARTHAARSTALAAAWAAAKASTRADAWGDYNAILEAMVEEARTEVGETDEWDDFADELEDAFAD
jgi:hypothetical protein